MILNFAWRYFKGKKSTQAIQLISWVSVGAIAIGTAALIIVLSVFNGFEGFIKDLYSNYYPQIKVSPIVGKTILYDQKFESALRQIKGIKVVSKTLEEKVLLMFNGNQAIATIKGIDSNYLKVSGIQKNIKYGELNLSTSNNIAPVTLGIGVSNRLGANEESHLPITCYAFKKGALSLMDLASPYTSLLFEVTGVYVLQDEIDNQFIFAPYTSVEELTEKPMQASAYEIAIEDGADIDEIRSKIKEIDTQNLFKVEDRYEQNKTLYFILKSERWAVYAILTLMLIIASFNVIGSMSMLVLEKEKDISILQALGMTSRKVKKIFVLTGILLSLVGASIGCLLAISICLLQQHFGFVKLGGEGAFLIEAYPVKLKVFDFVLVLVTVVIIAFFASLFPAIKASKKAITLRVI